MKYTKRIQITRDLHEFIEKYTEALKEDGTIKPAVVNNNSTFIYTKTLVKMKDQLKSIGREDILIQYGNILINESLKLEELLADEIMIINVANSFHSPNEELLENSESTRLRMELTKFLVLLDSYKPIFMKQNWRLSEYIILIRAILNRGLPTEVLLLGHLCETVYTTKSGIPFKFSIKEYLHKYDCNPLNGVRKCE